MSLLEQLRQVRLIRAGRPGSIAKLAARLEKRALDGAELAGATGDGAMMGVVSGGISGGIGGMFGNAPVGGTFSRGGVRNIAHKGLIGAAVGAVPFALYGAYNNYQEQRAREKALAEYRAGGGYGAEFEGEFGSVPPSAR